MASLLFSKVFGQYLKSPKIQKIFSPLQNMFYNVLNNTRNLYVPVLFIIFKIISMESSF